jgi:hypothetical protein
MCDYKILCVHVVDLCREVKYKAMKIGRPPLAYKEAGHPSSCYPIVRSASFLYPISVALSVILKLSSCCSYFCLDRRMSNLIATERTLRPGPGVGVGRWRPRRGLGGPAPAETPAGACRPGARGGPGGGLGGLAVRRRGRPGGGLAALARARVRGDPVD